MNSSWKAFRALSAASWMGMSLWRMYSASEQDQPPSVLLVGTFYKNQCETGRGGGGHSVPWWGGGTSHTSRFPRRMCSASRTELPSAPLTAPVKQGSCVPRAPTGHGCALPPHTSHTRTSPRGRPGCSRGAVFMQVMKGPPASLLTLSGRGECPY